MEKVKGQSLDFFIRERQLNQDFFEEMQIRNIIR